MVVDTDVFGGKGHQDEATGRSRFDPNADPNPAGIPRHPANRRSADRARKRRKWAGFRPPASRGGGEPISLIRKRSLVRVQAGPPQKPSICRYNVTSQTSFGTSLKPF